jgi:GH25 family lysozyme M1 (1,4-beta-N-acetylmuramidase)
MAVIFAGLGMLAGPGRARAQRPLGIDVSHWDGSITWSSVKNSGIAFAWAKATEGTDYTDDTFAFNEPSAKAAGVLIGAYHFAEYTNNLGLAGADAEANYFWGVAANYVKGGGYYLMPMLDVERDPSWGGYSKTTLSQWVNEWCSKVVSLAAAGGVTVKPVIYTGISFANTWLDSTVTQWPLWMANPNSQDPQTGGPNGTGPWSTWTLWQYSWTGSLPGVPSSGNIDMDAFHGTLSGLIQTLVIGGIVTNPPPPPPPAKVVGLFDLGPIGPTGLANPGGNGVKETYIVDVSKDGALAGSTDPNGNAFLWTATAGTISIGAGYALVGVDWYANSNVLAVANNWGNSTTHPWYWQGYYDGTSGSWTQLPGAGGSTSTAGYWFATGLGVASDNSDWWIGGYTTNTSTGNKQQTAYDYTNAPTAPQIVKFSNYSAGGHFWGGYMGASDTGAFVGTEEYGGSGSHGGGSVNAHWWQWQPTAIGSRPTFLGPPEAGNGTVVTTSYTCVAGAISGDGNIKGGLDKNVSTSYYGLWWDINGFVHKLPWLLIGGTTYANWMEIHCLNKDGTVMGGTYYVDPPTDSRFEAFVCSRSGTTITSTNKVGDLLSAQGINTNGWTFNDVTALSNDGNTLAGWGTTNGVTHAWLAQLPAPVIHITGISLSGGNALINFTSSGAWDTAASFTIQQCGTVNGTYSDVSPAASFTGSGGSFQATVQQGGNAQFYRIRHL